LDGLGAYSEEERKPGPPMYGEEWTVDRSQSTDAENFSRVVAAEHKKRVDRGDIKLLLNTRATDLLLEEGRVMGVKAQGEDGEEKEYKAGAVVLCTGGYASNADLVRRYSLPEAWQVISAAPIFCSGDGHAMCEKAGSKLVNVDEPHFYIAGVPDPDNPGRLIAFVNMGKYPGAVWVDLDGTRMVNEDCGAYIPKWFAAMANAPELALIVILDKRIMDENDPILRSWFAAPARSWEWFEEKAEEGVIIKKADTIEELANKLSIDARTLKGTIETYNGYVEAGEDLEFGRQDLVYKIENPPFYAIKTAPTTLISRGGPAVNIQQQVLDINGKVISGLYAAGEVAGFGGAGTGSGNTGCVVFGKQAGKMAAHEVLYRRF
jgi:succinate dehydrogenase/fumarate reductase flavoprotein subunit